MSSLLLTNYMQCRGFLASGKCELIEEFSRDKMRMGMKNMMMIWGVGEATVSHLSCIEIEICGVCETICIHISM